MVIKTTLGWLSRSAEFEVGEGRNEENGRKCTLNWNFRDRNKEDSDNNHVGVELGGHLQPWGMLRTYREHFFLKMVV